MECIGIKILHALGTGLQPSLVLRVRDIVAQNVQAKEGVLVEPVRVRFAAVLFDHPASGEVELEAGEQDIAEKGAGGDIEDDMVTIRFPRHVNLDGSSGNLLLLV